MKPFIVIEQIKHKCHIINLYDFSLFNIFLVMSKTQGLNVSVTSWFGHIFYDICSKKKIYRCVNPCHAEKIKMPHPLLISSQSDYLIQIVAYLMANSADPDQSEANWSGSTLFAKQGIFRFRSTRVKIRLEILRFSCQDPTTQFIGKCPYFLHSNNLL